MSKKNKSAFNLMSTRTSVKEKATHYSKRIGQSIKTTVLDKLEELIAVKKDRIVYLEQSISLETDKNRDIHALSKEDIQRNLEEVMDLEVEISVLEQKLTIKEKAYARYFKD